MYSKGKINLLVTRLTPCIHGRELLATYQEPRLGLPLITERSRRTD